MCEKKSHMFSVKFTLNAWNVIFFFNILSVMKIYQLSFSEGLNDIQNHEVKITT